MADGAATLDIDIRVLAGDWESAAPVGEAIDPFCARWIRAALQDAGASGGVDVLLTDDAHMRTLNRDHRGKDAPTNVLAFSAGEGGAPFQHLGDVALAFETLTREAADQGKLVGEHLAHLLVHGALHLAGFDHIDEADAAHMEAAERRVLAGGGLADPYIMRLDTAAASPSSQGAPTSA
ncbi:MAG: rRNA maturation RNase YbeY [Pseudomonadota bacterium]